MTTNTASLDLWISDEELDELADRLEQLIEESRGVRPAARVPFYAEFQEIE